MLPCYCKSSFFFCCGKGQHIFKKSSFLTGKVRVFRTHFTFISGFPRNPVTPSFCLHRSAWIDEKVMLVPVLGWVSPGLQLEKPFPPRMQSWCGEAQCSTPGGEFWKAEHCDSSAPLLLKEMRLGSICSPHRRSVVAVHQWQGPSFSAQHFKALKSMIIFSFW